jgi:hypothetical protein
MAIAFHRNHSESPVLQFKKMTTIDERKAALSKGKEIGRWTRRLTKFESSRKTCDESWLSMNE